LASLLYNSYKTAVNSNDMNAVINNSTLSTAIKNQLVAKINHSRSLSNADYATYFSNQVNEINNSAVFSSAEKEMLLTIDAIIYNSPMWPRLSQNGSVSSRKPYSRECTLFGPGGSGEASGATCIVAGAIIGGVVGYAVCGLPCAVGGAIIGGVMGAISS
jgi:hypothetical protein